MMDTSFFAQRLQCSRNDKEEALKTVAELVDIAYLSQGGVKALDEKASALKASPAGRFLGKALQLYMEAKNASQIRRVLYNLIASSNWTGGLFLQGVVITEALAALLEKEDMDFVFTFLVPSFFGIDYEARAADIYYNFKQQRLVAMIMPEDPGNEESSVYEA